ncbi:MAG: hypothetical protein JWO77_1571 [Ilumatobacteraceae bacterium]|nr:hypothetical protein [Ilumatobacteraceae bacterium]
MQLAHARRNASRAGARGRSQVGETLIEVLVAITLMGVGFTAIIGGIYTSVNIAETNQRYTRASIFLQAFAENVLQPAKTPPAGASAAAISAAASLYIPCADDYPAAVDTYQDAGIGAAPDSKPGPAWTARIIKVEYFKNFEQPLPNLQRPVWTEDRSYCQNLSSYNSPPPGDVPRDNGLQRLTLEVSNGDPAPDRPVKDTVVIIKRDRRCPNQYSSADLGPC